VLLADWERQTVLSTTKDLGRVVCVPLPFMGIPGLVETAFPNARVSYLSLVPRPEAMTPRLDPQRADIHQIPLLLLHTQLVDAYWSTGHGWSPWAFLERDFEALRNQGFRFRVGSNEGYLDVVQRAASAFADAVFEEAVKEQAQAIVVYGRGHWTMNSAAFAAEKLRVPLCVIERGILPDTYIADIAIPFTAPGSRFRRSWEEFCSVENWNGNGTRQLTESRDQLYDDLLQKSQTNSCGDRGTDRLIAGQCLFDYNCLDAPFHSPKEFVEYVIENCSELQNDPDNIRYKPHPLSPEEYPSHGIETRFGILKLDLSMPWQCLRSDRTIYTWNSTLGLEARLIFGLEVRILDSECHYRWAEGTGRALKARYIDFLNKYSILQ
jgi:hypothetical protein